MLTFTPDALVVSSFSKFSSMAGWRLGWLLVPEWHVFRARAYSGNLFLSAPSLAQHAGLAALDSQDELAEHLTVYTRNRPILRAALPTLGLDAIAPSGRRVLYTRVSSI